LVCSGAAIVVYCCYITRVHESHWFSLCGIWSFVIACVAAAAAAGLCILTCVVYTKLVSLHQ